MTCCFIGSSSFWLPSRLSSRSARSCSRALRGHTVKPRLARLGRPDFSAAGSNAATRRPSMSHRVRTVIGTIGILIGFVVVIGFVVLIVFYLHR